MAFTDNFDRADENLEASANWTHDGLIAGALAVRSNQLACLSSNIDGSTYKCPDQGSADHYVQYRVRGIGTSGAFACCRLADRNNYVGIRNDGGTLQVYRRVAGSLTALNTSAQGIVAGDVLRLECEGTNWRAYINGAQFAGAAGGGAIGSAGLTNQRQGVVGRAATANPWIDDFEAGSLAATVNEGVGTLTATSSATFTGRAIAISVGTIASETSSSFVGRSVVQVVGTIVAQGSATFVGGLIAVTSSVMAGIATMVARSPSIANPAPSIRTATTVAESRTATTVAESRTATTSQE